MFQTIRIEESARSATKVAFGLEVPVDTDFAVPCPPLSEHLEFADGSVTVRPRQRSAQKAPLASNRVMRKVLASFEEHHPVTRIAHDPEALERRQKAFRTVFSEIPAEMRPEQAPFVFGHLGHIASALGLSIDEVGALPAVGFSSADIDKWMREAVADGSFYVFDSEGKAFDEREEQAKAAAAAAAEDLARKLAEEEAERIRPNEKSLDELGWLGFEAVPGANVPEEVQGLVTVHTGECTYFLFPRAALFNVDVPSAEIALGVSILDGDFVLPIPARALPDVDGRFYATHNEGDTFLREAAATFARWFFRRLRPLLGVVTGGVRTEYDESTSEGRYRVELFESMARDEFLAFPRQTNPNAPKFGFLTLMLFDAGVHGLSLAEDVVANVMHRLLQEKWKRTNPKPEDWDQRERQRVETTRENIWAPGGGSAPAPKAWNVPRFPSDATEESLLDRYRGVKEYPYGHNLFNAGTPARPKPMFAPDELYVSADPNLLQRAKSLVFGEPWSEPIAKFVAGKDVVTSTTIEGFLRDAGYAASIMSAAQHRRVANVMKKLGWVKGETVIDGRRARAWRREAAK